jgi:hypothetical protein
MEEFPSSRCHDLRDIPGVEHETFAVHLELLHEAKLIEALDVSSFDGIDWIPSRITHQGYEFLDGLREDNLWNSCKEYSKKAAGVVSLETLKLALPHVLKGLF